MNEADQPVPAFEPESNPPAESTAQDAAEPDAAFAAALSLANPPAPPPLSMTLSEILQRSLQLLRAHFALLTGVALIPYAAMFLIFVPFFGAFFFFHSHNASTPASPSEVLWFLVPMFLLAMVVCIPLGAWHMAAASHASLSADSGIHLTLGQCLRLGWERLGRYSALMLLMQLYVLTPLLATFLPCVLFIASIRSAQGSAAVAFFLVPLFLIAFAGGYVWMFVMMLRLALAFPAAVAEDLGPIEAIRRSGQLTRDAKGRIFAAMVLIYAGTYALLLILILGLALVGVALIGAFASLHAGALLQVVGIGLLAIVYFVLILACTALPLAIIFATLAVFYRDQRLRVDGMVLPVAQIFAATPHAQ